MITYGHFFIVFCSFSHIFLSLLQRHEKVLAQPPLQQWPDEKLRGIRKGICSEPLLHGLQVNCQWTPSEFRLVKWHLCQWNLADSTCQSHSLAPTVSMVRFRSPFVRFSSGKRVSKCQIHTKWSALSYSGALCSWISAAEVNNRPQVSVKLANFSVLISSPRDRPLLMEAGTLSKGALSLSLSLSWLELGNFQVTNSQLGPFKVRATFKSTDCLNRSSWLGRVSTPKQKQF